MTKNIVERVHRRFSFFLLPEAGLPDRHVCGLNGMSSLDRGTVRTRAEKERCIDEQ